MMCRVCGGRFDDRDVAVSGQRVAYGDGYVTEETGYDCPNCGAALSVEGYCRECGDEVPQNELEEGLCRLCTEETKESLEWMWGMLSPSQKAWARSHEYWMQ